MQAAVQEDTELEYDEAFDL
ncbi:hypothetical protein Pcinc_013436, partial [Petrolisthes cinctipes]